MNCGEVDRFLKEGSGRIVPPQIQEHIKNCERCREYTDVLGLPISTDLPSAESLHRIEQRIVADLKPVRPMMPAISLVTIFLTISVAVVFFSTSWMGAFGIAAMSLLQSVVVLSVLALAALFLSRSLAGLMAPGSRHRISPWILPGIIVVVISIMIVALFQFRHDRHFWTNARICLSVGILIGGLTAIPFWTLLRRGAVLSSKTTGSAAGLLAGITGMTVLEIHCPNLDASHILTSHLGAVILCTLAGFVLGIMSEIVGNLTMKE